VIHNTNVKGGSRSGGRGRKRTYESPLREEQAEATRERILEALVRAMADGLATLSVPAVAREAGVSTPTIYRHFGSKAGLLDALGPYVTAKAGLVPETMPETLEDFDDSTRTIFRNLDAMDATLRAALASQLGREVRQAGMPWRRAIHRDAIRRSAPELPDEEIERLTDLSIVLTSSGTFRVYRDYLGLDADEAADRATWALRMLVQGARSAAMDR
jgi:AcrR family transcriptional regulator